MSHIKNPERIIDKETLLALRRTGDALAQRDQCMQQLKPVYQQAAAEIKKRFEENSNASANVHETAYLIDSIIEVLFAAAKQAFNINKPAMALVAVGGYGRGQLFPYSDIDLLFLHAPKAQTDASRIAEFILYILWDLGLTVGQAVRDEEETLRQARADITTRTTLLDMRHIIGDAKLSTSLRERFRKEVVAGSEIAFVEGKLAERDGRHHRCGDSRYVLEPNVKEGKGGLRDLHTLYWLAKYNYQINKISELVKLELLTTDEYKAFTKSEQFLWVVRVWLHYLAGRAEERLTFDMQRAIGEKLGYREKEDTGARSVERFMKRYFMTVKTVGNLTRTVCAILEEEKKRKPRLSIAGLLGKKKSYDGFIIEGERLNFADNDAPEKDPVKMLELFRLGQDEDLDIHPHALQWVSRNLSKIDRAFQSDKRANDVLLAILLGKHPDITLRRMNEAGLLGKCIPDFGRVIGQMQFDMYHTFTVDEHTIFAIGILYGIEHGKYKEESPVATEIIHLVRSRRVLYLALLCHDIAKGRGGDHSELGEKVAHKLAQRFGFDEQESETAAWLVRYHLLMSSTAFKRDINDPKTIRDFVEKVQSPERLRLLLVLTVADIRAVGPKIWNGWKGALLRELYYKAEAMMGAGEILADAERKKRLSEELEKELTGWDRQEIDHYVELGTPSFWAICDAPAHARLARMLRELAGNQLPFNLATSSDDFRSITEVLLVTPDQHGLFSKVAGAMAISGANIVDCKIFTLKNGVAVEIFRVQDIEGKAFDKADKIAKMKSNVEMAIAGRLGIEAELAKKKRSYPSRVDAFRVPASVFVENTVSTTHTVVEVGGQDRIGFLYTVTRAIAELGLTISTAHISTYGERAVDVFYVKDIFGMKITNERKLQQIEDTLRAALAPRDLKQAG